MRILSSGLNLRRVLRLISRTAFSTAPLSSCFCLIFVPFSLYDEPKTSALTITLYLSNNDGAHAGARINANAFGVGTISVDFADAIPPGSPAITFFDAKSLPVAEVQRQATTVDVDPAGLILTATQPFSITVTENFNRALTSATDEAGLGPASAGGSTVDTVVRLAFSNVPAGATITFVDFAGSSSTLTPTTLFTNFTAGTGSQTTVVDVAITATNSTGANEALVVNFTGSVPAGGITPGVPLGSVGVALVGGTAPDVPTFVANTQGGLLIFGPSANPLVIVSGNMQIGTVGTELPQPLVVKVQDENGNPVTEETVTFAATSGGGEPYRRPRLPRMSRG